MVPVVIVEPGEHTLTIQPDGTDEILEFTATFAPDASYRVDELLANVKPLPADDASNNR